jgi:hypothetical protein
MTTSAGTTVRCSGLRPARRVKHSTALPRPYAGPMAWETRSRREWWFFMGLMIVGTIAIGINAAIELFG